MKLSLAINKWKLFFKTLRHGENLDRSFYKYINDNDILNPFQIITLILIKGVK